MTQTHPELSRSRRWRDVAFFSLGLPTLFCIVAVPAVPVAITPFEAVLIDFAVLLWIVAFTLFIARIGAWLFRPGPQENP
ncbi:hypothetical protein [Pontibaca salina]|uniref:Uncharacterized protein n=1 Tax=Pontibaca salina TaxID=2795731 RepID=A0A934HSC6_9RHOB|nr:hypothetical protein [Pontibaca salina]MBI6630902.1 hypothetical protein [Pontibaca salina]